MKNTEFKNEDVSGENLGKQGFFTEQIPKPKKIIARMK